MLIRRGNVIKQLDESVLAGTPPAVVLIDPKYPHNVGSILRTCACYGINQIWFTGTRVKIHADGRERLPREERLRNYNSVELIQTELPLSCFSYGTPVAVEFRNENEDLCNFLHPPDAIYVFGPEDGSLPRAVLKQCHRFVRIPTRHCLNLAVAVATVLYDRISKEDQLD